MTSTLHYDNARIAQQLFNNEAKNLQALNDRLGVKVTCRDGWIKLEGEEENVRRHNDSLMNCQRLMRSLLNDSPPREDKNPKDYRHTKPKERKELIAYLKDACA